MKVYERETHEIAKRFLDRRLSFPDCIAAQDAGLAALMPTLTGEQIARLRAVMLANNETVMMIVERPQAKVSNRRRLAAAVWGPSAGTS